MEKISTLSSQKSVVVAGAALVSAAALYYLTRSGISTKPPLKMICDKSFKDDSLVSFAKEADARSKQISNVAYKLLIKLGTTQE